MSKVVVHSIGRPVKIGLDARTRCGKSASVDTVGVGAASLIDASGNQFFGSTHAEAVTCKKCINLLTIGTIHDKPRRPTDTAKRPMVATAVATSNRAVASAVATANRRARSVAGPDRGQRR